MTCLSAHLRRLGTLIPAKTIKPLLESRKKIEERGTFPSFNDRHDIRCERSQVFQKTIAVIEPFR